MKIPDFILRFLGRQIANKLQLEDKMDGTKPWYKSQTLWAGIAVFVRGIYQVAQIALPMFTSVHLPPIPPTFDAILGSILGGAVVQGRYTATQTIG